MGWLELVLGCQMWGEGYYQYGQESSPFVGAGEECDLH